VFDDLTPLELHDAIKDKAEHMTQYEFLHLDLLRLHAVIQRNKGLKAADQTRKPSKFYEFPWERTEKKPIEIPDWEALDRKYCRN
jgi:hypothetical protein